MGIVSAKPADAAWPDFDKHCGLQNTLSLRRVAHKFETHYVPSCGPQVATLPSRAEFIQEGNVIDAPTKPPRANHIRYTPPRYCHNHPWGQRYVTCSQGCQAVSRPVEPSVTISVQITTNTQRCNFHSRNLHLVERLRTEQPQFGRGHEVVTRRRDQPLLFWAERGEQVEGEVLTPPTFPRRSV